ncbi:hypothetical protein [Azospirillum sp. A39]|uniref:hypothetical protein n=1 Tax=Azospirillum sp. A39 TaxID=3462279 RepID=UPI00404594F0
MRDSSRPAGGRCRDVAPVVTGGDRNPLDRPVRVHGREEACTALAAAAALGVPVALASAVGAAAHGGALWFRLLVEAARADWPGVAVTTVLDCADRAGDAQAALAAGIDHVLFRGPRTVAERLDDIARQRGATVLTTLAEPLDLRGAADPTAACRAWLAAGGRPPG